MGEARGYCFAPAGLVMAPDGADRVADARQSSLGQVSLRGAV
jgi:hypothetical protein